MNIIQRLGARLLGLEVKAKNDSTRVSVIVPGQSGKPLTRNEWNTSNAIQDGLKASTWVYACVKRKARTASSVPLIVERYNPKTDTWTREPNHPLESLLREPNQHMTGQQLLRYMVYHLELGGESYTHIVTARDVPVELWTLMPDQVKPIPDAVNFLAGFEYRIGSSKQVIEPKYVIQMLYEDPGNFYHGLSPLKAAANAVDTDIDAVKFNRVAMQNRTATDGVFSTEQVLSDDQYQRIKKQVKEQHLTPDNARTPWVLGAGMAWQPMTQKLEMDFLSSRPFTRDEIYTVFGVPVLLDNATGSTFANMATAKKLFWEDTLIPLLEDVCTALTFALVPWFEPSAVQNGAAPTLRVNVDLSNVTALQDNLLQKAQTAMILVKAGYSTESVNTMLELNLESTNTPAPIKNDSRGITAFKRQFKNLDWNEEQKSEFWKARDAPRATFETVIQKAVSKAFDVELKTVLENLDDPESGLKDKIWNGILETAYSEITRHFAELEGKRLESTKGVNTFFDPARLKHWIQTTAAEQIKNILQTTREALKREIEAAITNNEGSKGLANRIKNLYQTWSTSRATTIARTETGRAANYGTLEGATTIAESLNVELEKSWITSRDNRVRDAHAALDGETVKSNESFSNGLDYPNEINCRCVLAYSVIR